MFTDKVLLITGGTGSFGNAVLKKFLSSELKEIRIFSRDEKKQNEMRNHYKNNKIKFYIGDVRNFNSINSATKGVDFVFHAAALKQVPSCEFFPIEAVKTNILGTENVIQAAINNKVRKIICLSTDKAAYPINAMGISKALMEKVAIAMSRNVDEKHTIICCTRYGNVMASRGSVIPLFVDQIRKKLPMTLTDPNMTRFLMSLDDAVDLVLFAFKNAKQGDLFVQKAPASTIKDLAEAVKQIFNSNSELKNIGTRHGEKLYETLLTREEIVNAEDLRKFYRISADTRNLNYGKFFIEGEESISRAEDYNSHNTKRLTIEEIKQKLLKLDYIQDELKNFEQNQ